VTHSPTQSPHDRPDQLELLEAVREFLLAEPADGPRDRLHRRVAANVVGLVERELSGLGQDTADHRARLARLGVDDNHRLAELAAALDERDPLYPALTDALADWARRKVAVVNPAYLEEEHP
jgi:hypothetical protein